MVDQITAEELAEKVDAGEPFTLVDTRSEDSFESWHIRGAVNVPFDPSEGFDADHRDRLEDVADGEAVIAICGKGLTSTPFAIALEERGYEDVTVVKGGMEDWSKVYDVVPIGTAPDDLVIRQVQRRGKGCLGYVVGSRGSGEAAVVDATRQIEAYAVAAEEAGLTITAAVDTHIHADHISGTPRLAETLDVPYYLGARAAERDVEYDYLPVEAGDVIQVGAVELDAMPAPGHTAEMVNYRVGDEALLTGDTLFVDSVGRTELQFGEADAAAAAEQLYETLHEGLLAEPDDLRVLPGHVSVTADGTYQGGSPGDPIGATLGTLRASIELLQLDRDAFVERLTEDAPEKPPNYESIMAINTGKETVEREEDATALELGPNNCAA